MKIFIIIIIIFMAIKIAGSAQKFRVGQVSILVDFVARPFCLYIYISKK